jgi:hypothetical protein
VSPRNSHVHHLHHEGGDLEHHRRDSQHDTHDSVQHYHHKGKSKGYMGVSRKERIHHEFEAEDLSWLSAVTPLFGAVMMQRNVNMMFEGMHKLLPELSQEHQSRDELLHVSCLRLRDLLQCRKVIFMEVDTSNNFAAVASSDSSSHGAAHQPLTNPLTNDAEVEKAAVVETPEAGGFDKMPGGCGILPLDPDAPGVLLAGAALHEVLDDSLLSVVPGGVVQVEEPAAHAQLPMFMRVRMAAKDRADKTRKMQERARAAWKNILGPVAVAQSLLSHVCVDEEGRLHGAFLAVDHRIDALPGTHAMEFNEIHGEVLRGVSRHVASLLTHNEESTAKSARLQSSNELISALQDVALCTDTERLFSLIRQRFPPLANCQVVLLLLLSQCSSRFWLVRS